MSYAVACSKPLSIQRYLGRILAICPLRNWTGTHTKIPDVYREASLGVGLGNVG